MRLAENGASVPHRRISPVAQILRQPEPSQVMHADILRARMVRSVVWFHTDHWEPWGRGIDDAALTRVERFTAQAGSSDFGRKMTLFYLSGTNYRLKKTSRTPSWHHREELLEAQTRSSLQDRLAHHAVGELSTRIDVEFQVHLHHEHLASNDGEWNDLHRALKRLTDPEQDERRLHYLLRTELDRLRRDTSLPLERWAFIHGMWALNGSDRNVCKIDNEIAILMQHGCWGDFSFPAARRHCDPTVFEQPYTCVPFVAPKAYDRPESLPLPIDVGTHAITDERFLIWSCKAKHDVCHLDHFNEYDQNRLRNSERIIHSWLSNCPVVDQTLYIKTHAHSMHSHYFEDGGSIPVAFPPVRSIFDLLEKACDAAKIELRAATVNEVFAALRAADSRSSAGSDASAASVLEVSSRVDIPLDLAEKQDSKMEASFSATDQYAVSVLRDWLATEEARQRSAGSYYMQRLSRGRLFVDSELAIAEYCRKRFDSAVRFFELGFGFGELSLLLALSGFSTTGYEADAGRYAGARVLADALADKNLDLSRLSLVNGSFPDALELGAMGAATAVLVATNVTSSYLMHNIDYVYRAMRLFDHVIVDLSRFGAVRNQSARQKLLSDLQEAGFVNQGPVYSTGGSDVRHFHRQGAAGAGTRVSAPDHVRYSDTGHPVPSRLLTAPCLVFDKLEIPIQTIFPRLGTVPPGWHPKGPPRIAAIRSPWKSNPPSTPPAFRDGGENGSSCFVFPDFGAYRVESSFGVFKCLLLDPIAGKDKQALEIFRFAAENIVHSSIDRATIVPWGKRTRYIRPDLLLHKLFLSDQPLGLHCDSAAETTGYLLHLNGYQVREIWLVDPRINSGHVVLEVLLPERQKWVMLDPDFGVIVTDREGIAVGTADIVGSAERKRDLVVDRVVEKHWARSSFDVAEAYTGQLAWQVDAYSGRETVQGDSYHEMMDKLFRVRRVMTYRFENGFDEIRSEPVETNAAGESNPVSDDVSPASALMPAPAGHAPSAAAPVHSQSTAVSPGGGPPASASRPVTNAAPPLASQDARPAASDEGLQGATTNTAFDPFTMFKDYFRLVGQVRLESCPLCDSRRIAQLWRLPQSRLDGKTYLSAPGKAHNNTYLDFLPLLKVPQEVYGFDICADCHSIFRNPKDDDQETYKRDSSKVRSFKEQGLDPFRGAAATCEAFFPPDTRIVVDAACGSGQILAIYKDKRPELKLFGLELSTPSVEWIKQLGIGAAVTDLDLDDLDIHVAPNTVDFIVFNEAFEHVRSPTRVLRKLFRMLRPGGRIHFTAQYFGPENNLQVRVGEPIYIDRYGLDWVIDQLGAKLVHLAADIKYRVTLEKAA